MKKLFLIVFLATPTWGATYKHILNSTSLLRIEDNATIPADPKNRDYADFLASGATALPADPGLTPTEINLLERSDAITDLLTAPDDRAKLTRAILQVLFDENNNSREWIQVFKGQVAAATSLADLKTRVATLPDMPDRTVSQAITAVQNKINTGLAD